jgi:hypothetical protein
MLTLVHSQCEIMDIVSQIMLGTVCWSQPQYSFSISKDQMTNSSFDFFEGLVGSPCLCFDHLWSLTIFGSVLTRGFRCAFRRAVAFPCRRLKKALAVFQRSLSSLWF